MTRTYKTPEATRQRVKARRDAMTVEQRRAIKAEQYAKPGNKERIISRIRKKRLENPSYYLWAKARTRAKQDKLKFDIIPDDVPIPDKCPILGYKLVPLSGDDNAPTIDRIKPWLGYVKGNVAVISRRANTLKRDASLRELKQIVAWLEKQ